MSSNRSQQYIVGKKSCSSLQCLFKQDRTFDSTLLLICFFSVFTISQLIKHS